jgi:hypothetical protein
VLTDTTPTEKWLVISGTSGLHKLSADCKMPGSGPFRLIVAALPTELSTDPGDRSLLMARITADRLIQHLTASGFVVMKGQPVEAEIHRRAAGMDRGQ